MTTKNKYIEEGKRLGVYNPDNKLAIIVGYSPQVRKHIELFYKTYGHLKFDVISVNKSITLLPKVDHWCSMHPFCWMDSGWFRIRREKGFNLKGIKTHSPDRKYEVRGKFNEDWRQWIQYPWKAYNNRGSSALFAVCCAMGMGYKGVIVLGVELVGTYRRYLAQWQNFNRAHRHYMKSTHGCLNVFIGTPTRQWFNKVLN